MARHRAVEHEVHDGARGVEEELEHRPRPPERRVLPADGRRRVDEHARAAPVELAEHRIPDRVAEVGPADVGEQDEPVDVEVVDAVRDLGDRGVDVRKRERAEQTEATRMVDDRAPAGLVHLAGEVARGRRSSARWTPGRRDRQERRGDPEPVHQRDVLLRRPRRDLRHAVGLAVAGALERLPVGLGQVVGVDVELAEHRHRSIITQRVDRCVIARIAAVGGSRIRPTPRAAAATASGSSHHQFTPWCAATNTRGDRDDDADRDAPVVTDDEVVPEPSELREPLHDAATSGTAVGAPGHADQAERRRRRRTR